ncbi:MAG: hypothetical protein M3Q30_07755 [Actinomycetota bacterium]|nr:hypothetical protein [Actinomycetota bacterium]
MIELTSDEIAEIDRTFAFDSDAKSVTIMRLVAHARSIEDRLDQQSDRLVEAIAAAIDDHTETTHGYVLGTPERDGLATAINSAIGTPAVMLGFTRDEIEAMEGLAFPEPIESWLHGLVSAALSGEVAYKHRFAQEPSGDASRGPHV